MIQTSEPIVATFENTSTTESKQVIFLNAFASTSKNAAGNFITNYGMDIKIDVPALGGGVPYGVFLQALKSQPMNVGKIYIQSNNNAQITKSIQVVNADSFGNYSIDLIFPKLDPMQSQSSVLMLSKNLNINGYSSLRFGILPNTSITMSLYPSDQINEANQLIGQSIIDQYRFKSISQFDS